MYEALKEKLKVIPVFCSMKPDGNRRQRRDARRACADSGKVLVVGGKQLLNADAGALEIVLLSSDHETNNALKCAALRKAEWNLSEQRVHIDEKMMVDLFKSCLYYFMIW